MSNFVRMFMMDVSKFRAIVIFDGQCVLCGKAVQWLIKKDKNHVLGFTANDSKWAQTLFAKIQTNAHEINSVVLYEVQHDTLFFKSKAVKKAIRFLSLKNSLWLQASLIYLLANDFLYNIVAKYRYKIFGKLSSCTISEEMKSRYIY